MGNGTAVRGFDPDANEAAAIAAAAIRSAEPSITALEGENGLYAVPDGDGSTRIVSLEEYQAGPNRPKGNNTVADVDSFIAFTRRFVSPATAISLRDATALAVLNFHAPRGVGGSDVELEVDAGWADFRCDLALGHSPEWVQWSGGNGRAMPQREFAEWLELLRADVVEPDGGRLLEIIRDLEGTIGATYHHATNLENGDRQLVYQEETVTTIQIPRQFTVRLRVYNGDLDPVDLTALLRYRVANDTVTFTYTFGRALADAIEIARDAWHARVREAFPETLIVRAP